MSERLGEMLLHGGALTEAQLEEVLSAQSIYGGRLGTNLVEMGFLSEEDLARMLNEKLGVPCVDATSLETVDESLLSRIPHEMAQRFKVLPVALEGRRLTLAMADPSNFGAIDEIGFFTGLVIVPRVCSELRLSMALERHYGIKQVLHFIPVAGGVRTRMINMTRETAGLAPSTAGLSLASGPEPAPDPSAQIEDADDGPGARPGPRISPGASRSTGAGTAASSDISIGTGVGSKGSAGAGFSASTGPGFQTQRLGMQEVATRFAAASGEGEVVATLMSYLKEEFDRAGLLSIKRGSAVGVQGVAGGVVLPTFAGCVIGLEDAALLKRILKERAPYLGKLPETGAERQVLEKLGGRPGGSSLLQPIAIGGVAVAFLLVEDEKGRLGCGLTSLQRVVAKAELAFEMLGIRKKIGLV